MSKVYVFAGNQLQADRFFHEHHVPKNDRCYVHDDYQLRGIRGATLHIIGTYTENRDFWRIIDVAKAQGFDIKYGDD